MNDHSDTDDPNGDGEGVWSPDIEQSFREALILIPPCGRRKHILQEEGGGKMYGRNELIARHILMRTGKVRTRKQVSSHIQVLARRKAKADAPSGAGSLSPASSMGTGGGPDAGSRLGRPESTASASGVTQANPQLVSSLQLQQTTGANYCDVWNDRPIVTPKIRLVEFSAFIEYRQSTNTHIVPSMAFTIKPELAPVNDLTSIDANATNSINLDQHHLMSHQQYQQPPISNATNQLHHQMPSAFGANGVVQPTTTTSIATTLSSHSPHPLASSHQLPMHFKQDTANSTTINYHPHQSNQPLNNNNNQHHLNQQQQGTDLLPSGMTVGMSVNQMQMQHHQQQLQSSTGFTRHSYVKIDYRQPISTHTNKLERIGISQIQDKFPKIGGSDGLFQKGPSDAFFLVKFWADLNNDYEYNIEDQNSNLWFSSHFETVNYYKELTCSTKACSYGHPMVEHVEKIFGASNNLNGRYSYDMNRSQMCEFMKEFIKKLRQLSRASQMNSVLENFSVLQVVTSESTSEILLCLAYVFEIASPEQNRGGSSYHVYKLTKD